MRLNWASFIVRSNAYLAWIQVRIANKIVKVQGNCHMYMSMAEIRGAKVIHILKYDQYNEMVTFT